MSRQRSQVRVPRPAFLAVRILLAGVVLASALAPGSLRAQEDDIRAAVVRVAWLAGEVGYSRGDDPDRWDAASPNFPMVAGDRLYTGRDGRVELEVPGTHLFLAEGSDLNALDLAPGWTQLSLTGGTLVVQVRVLEEGDRFEIGTPSASVSLEGTGSYRVDVDRDGNATVSVLRGRAYVESPGGNTPLREGDSLRVGGGDQPWMDLGNVPPPDRIDRWVEDRSRRLRRVRSDEWAGDGIEGLADLDEAGRWQQVPEYGWAWTPSAVAADWAPYRDGRWVWQDPWGWTWVASEAWGWAPYHYGRWAHASGRWWWVPTRGGGRPSWSPALVAFVGGGPGWSPAVSGTGGYVGWIPLGPRDPFHPWWRPGLRVGVPPPPSSSYVNHGFVTVVRRNDFVSGTFVRDRYVRDQDVVRQVGRADVIRGPIPVLPVRASLQVSPPRSGQLPVARPPASGPARQVFTRGTPPPPPPLFNDKIDGIRGRGGAPVAPPSQARGPHATAPPQDSQRGRPVQVSTPVPAPAWPGSQRPDTRTTPPPQDSQRGRPVQVSTPVPAPAWPGAQRPDTRTTPPPQDSQRGRPVQVSTPVPAPAWPSQRPDAGSPPPPQDSQRGRPVQVSTPVPAPAWPSQRPDTRPTPPPQDSQRGRPVQVSTPAPAGSGFQRPDQRGAQPPASADRPDRGSGLVRPPESRPPEAPKRTEEKKPEAPRAPKADAPKAPKAEEKKPEQPKEGRSRVERTPPP